MSSTPVCLDNAPFQPPQDAPQWFLDNIRQPGASHSVTVAGDRIHFLAWNLADESLPVLLLVHGFGGHAHWWSFLAPFFADRYRVIAIDLPGMGDSGHRAEYDSECFGRAILGVIHHYKLAPVTIVGHSFGGTQSMYAMTLEPGVFRRGIVIDSQIWFPQERAPSFLDQEARHKRRPTREDCQSRFRLTPPQPEAMEAPLQFVGYHSCTVDNDGWYWKFDPNVRATGAITDPQLLTRIPVRVDCIYGEHSIYNKPDLPRRVHECFPNFGELVIVPGAYHHLMMDHPLELVAAIRRLLDCA